MTAHPSQSSTLHYLYGENRGTKAGRAALLLPSNDICSQRQARHRSSFTSLSLHLSPSMVIFLTAFLSPFPSSLSVTHSAEGIQRSDNEIMTQPFQPFKSGPFSFCLPSAFILNPSFIDLLIFTCSHVSDITEEIAASVVLETECINSNRGMN